MSLDRTVMLVVTYDWGGIDPVVEAVGALPWEMCDHSHCVIDIQFCSESCMGYPVCWVEFLSEGH